MAVVVQRMSPSIVGGVAFSADPETGERCVIIEAAAGRRGAVESGTVEPIRWVIDARDEIIESYAGQTDSPVIDDDHLLELAGIVRKVAASFGCPQDIEWVYDGRRFQLLQTRPITTLVGKHIYSNRLVADMSPGLVKPLLWSTNTVSMARNVFGRIFTELIGPNDIDFSLLSRRFHSRIYTDMTMLGELLETIGLPANMFEMMARDEKGERPPFRFSMIRLLRHGRLLRFLWRQAGSKKSIAAFVKKQNLDLEPHRRVEPSSLTPTELAQRADDLMELHGRSQWHVFGAALNMMIRKRLLDRFLKRHAPDVSAQELLHGLSGLKGLEPNEELREMAACAGRLNPGDVDAMSRGLDEDIRERLSRHSEGQELIRKFDGFLNCYGYLSANGTDFSEESWIERPDLVWRSIVRHIETDDEPRGPETEDPVKRVTDHIDSIQRLQFDKLFSSTVDYMRLREQTSLLLSEDAYQMRRVFLAIGNALVETGALDDANDVFYLYIDELRNLVDGPEHEGDLQRIVRERRDEMERDAAIDPPHTISGDTPPRLPIQANRVEFLAGIGGSAGIVEGRVVVVREPADAPDNLTKNDILVVPFTDISWTPLFPSIGGIIAEAGGQLSHTAIIAREYNLPAVVSVRRATHVLKDGQVVTLDGRTGRVYIEDDSERKGAPK
jgi:pyruvate,water dikinase